MKIKAQDLRIGNLIFNPYNEITEVDVSILEYLLKCEKTKQPNDRYKSIPLTNDWMDKIILKEVSRDGHRIYFKIEINFFDVSIIKCIEKSGSLYLITFQKGNYSTWTEKIEYIHDIQNIFHKLTNGKELTIKQ